MFKEKVVKGVICLGVMGMLLSSGLALGKEPAKEEQGKETEKKGTQTVGIRRSKEGQTIKLAGVSASEIKVGTITQLTTDGGYGDYLVGVEWSPDGTKLLTHNKYGTLTIIYVNDSGQVDLSATGDDYSWSPDGSKIVFEDWGHNLWIMDTDGSSKIKLTTHISYPAWSFDGTKIAFSSLTGLGVINIDGSGQTELVAGEIYRPIVWLPSGKIAYRKEEDDKFNLYTINSDGTNEKKLDENVFTVIWWRSTKSKVFYNTSDDWYVMDEDGENKIIPIGNKKPNDWSPDGTKFAGTKGECDEKGAVIISGEIYLINYDGTGANQLTNTSNLIEEVPKWSPVGDKIAYIDLDNGNIYLMTLEEE